MTAAGGRAALVRAIETAALWSWPPAELHAFGGWLARAASDISRRANSCSVLSFDGSMGAPAAVAAVESWYALRDKPAIFQLADLHEPAGLDGLLARRGYRLVAPVTVLTRDLATAPAAPTTPVELHGRPSNAVMEVLADPRMDDATRRARAELFGRLRRPAAFALAATGGEPAAAGMAVVSDGLAGVFGMRTAPLHRRRGLGAAVLARLLAWARGLGAGTAYLQVEDGNEAALALYRRFDFEPTYRYWYRHQR